MGDGAKHKVVTSNVRMRGYRFGASLVELTAKTVRGRLGIPGDACLVHLYPALLG